MIDIDVLFITNKEDVSVEYLISKLKEVNAKFIRINSEDIHKIAFNIDPSYRFSISIEGVNYNLSTAKSVLFKRTPSKFDFDKDDEDQIYLNGERKHFLEGLYLCLNKAKWINPMFSTHTGERKVFQLKVAIELELETPNSIITNDPIIAHNFLQQHEKCIIKPISNGLQVLKDKVYSIYTSDIDNDFFLSALDKGLFETPVFLQERVPNSYDIRVIVINKKIFAVRIEKDLKEEVDWRKPEIQKKYTEIKLPSLLEDKLIALNKRFDLIYSAIDLIEKPDGTYVFLEVNPVGEWVWLEYELDLNISSSIISELLWQK